MSSSSPTHAHDEQEGRARYVRPPRVLHFPESATVPETKRHFELRTLLYMIVKHAFAEHASIGCDQFVYLDASDPSRCLSPDLFVQTGRPDSLFGSWKVWERGTPQLAVEIVSVSDASESAWEEKLKRYHALGVEELVRFDAEASPGNRLRVWDRIEGDLVERVVEGETAACKVLGLWWVIRSGAGHAEALRLAHDQHGTDLLPTGQEAEAAARQAEAAAAARRIKELEEELLRRR